MELAVDSRHLLILRFASLLIMLGGVAPLLAEETGNDLAINRLLLDKWKHDPDHYSRLQADLRAFYSLPGKRQDELREMDRQFSSMDEKKQRHLREVLLRYASWIDNLPEGERARIETIPNRTEKLEAIRQLRYQEWEKSLPLGMQEDLNKALLLAPTPARKKEVIARFRKEELQQYRKIQQVKTAKVPAPPHLLLRPAVVEQLPEELKIYLEKELKPQLSRQELEQLKESDSKYPQLLQTIHQLGENHPILPKMPGKYSSTTYQTLPPEYQKAIPRTKLVNAKVINNDKHVWPTFALHVNQFARKEVKDYSSLPPLGAAQPFDFPQPIRDWIETRLMPVLKKEDREKLKETEKKWPEYPETLYRYARSYKIPLPPQMSLPGPRDMWDAALGKQN